MVISVFGAVQADVGEGIEGLATLRLDGFVCLEAKEDPGTIITRPFKLLGSRLQVNVEATDGELRVEVLDAHSNPVKGFSGSHAETYAGIDGLRFEPTWGRSDLSELVGEIIHLKFSLKNAKLYAFQIR